MKIVHLNTLDTGGAATAAYRVHQSVQSTGLDSTMLVLKKTMQDDSVRSIAQTDQGAQIIQRLFQRWNALLSKYPNRPRGVELFSDPHSPIHLSVVQDIAEADIIHLHWTAGLLNLNDIVDLAAGKKIVWTLHDMNPFTGGCHYAGKCNKYQNRCGGCPQLGSSESDDLSHLTWQAKSAVYEKLDLTLVAPSRWLGDCIGKSSLLGRFDRHIIPYGLPLEQFRPIADPTLRRRFNIPEGVKIILFGAENTRNPRKGLVYLLEAFRRLDADRYNAHNLCLLVFGNFFKAPLGMPFKVVSTGRIDDRETLARLYSAADLFALPSLEDNLPNTAIEAMACGTPVVAFNSGGIVDIVDHKQTGYLAETGNPRQLAQGLDWVLCAGDKKVTFETQCRNRAQALFSPDAQADAYQHLYHTLWAKSSKSIPICPVGNSKWPTITVVTPSFNQAAYLETCMRSVLDQDYPNIEYIVMDGGSKDGSVDIINRHAQRLAYWQSRPYEGQYAAIQAGFERSTGDIMTWINADDILHPEALRIVAATFMQRPDVQWLSGRPNGIDDKGHQSWVPPILPLWNRSRYLNKQYKTPYIQQEGTFWRRELWQKAGARLETELNLAGDLALWARFFRHDRLHSVDFRLGAFRSHAGQNTEDGIAAYNAEAEVVLDREIQRQSDEKNSYMPAPPIPITHQQIEAYLQQTGLSRSGRQMAEDGSDTVERTQPPLFTNTPLVSAIVSTYNSERFIRGCLEDLIAQTIADRLEIIVIDSASEENEADVVKEFQALYPNIRYIRTQCRESVYRAWNRGIKLARGTYVTNANTDDRHKHDAFERMVAVLEAEPQIALVYADVIQTATANETFHKCTPIGVLRWFEWKRERLLSKGCFIGPQPMWRKSVHEYYGYFDETWTVVADYEFWLRISQTFDFKRIPKPLGLYLNRPDSVEHANHQRKKEEDRQVHGMYQQAYDNKVVVGFVPFEQLRNGSKAQKRRALDEIRHAAPRGRSETERCIDNLYNELREALAHGPDHPARLEAFIDNVSHYFITRDQTALSDDRVKQKGLNSARPTTTMRHSMSRGGPTMQLADTIYHGIQSLLKGGHKASAQWALKKFVDDYSNHAKAHFDLAMLAHEQNDDETANVHFQRAAENAPGDAVIQKSLGDFYHVVQGRTDDALAQYQKVLTLRPDDTETLLICAHLNLSLRRMTEAKQLYQCVLAIDPDQTDVRQILDRLQQHETADPEALYQKAGAHIQAGRLRDAMTTLEKLVASNPDHALAHNDLGVLRFESGDLDSARLHYEKAAELEPENATFQKNLADFYYVQCGEVENALKKYVQALTLDPEDTETLISTGHICMAVNQNDDARVFFQRALEIEPWHHDANELLQQLDAVAPTAAGTGQPDLYTSAMKKADAGDAPGAVRDLEQLVSQGPRNALAYNDLGVLYYDQGNKPEALRNYEQAARLNPENTTFLKNLADFYFVEQGRMEDALRLYIRILEMDREDVDCLMAAGTICVKVNQPEDARTFYERVLEIEPWNAVAGEALDQIGSDANKSGGLDLSQRMAL